MADDLSKIVPDFLLSDELVEAITNGQQKSGESKYYTLEQKPGKTLLYGMNAASYVKDSYELTDEGVKQKEEVWNVEELKRYQKSARRYNIAFWVVSGIVVLLALATVLLLELKF